MASTRNIFKGNIETIDTTGSTALVGVLVENEMIHAQVPTTVVTDRDMAQGRPGHVLFNEDAVKFVKSCDGLDPSDSFDQFTGKVVDIETAPDGEVIVVETPGMLKVYGKVTKQQATDLDIKAGDTVTAVVSKVDVDVTTPDFMPDTE